MQVLKTIPLVLLALAVTACSGGNSRRDDGVTPPPAASTIPPTFRGILATSTAGGNTVRLDWREALDDDTAVAEIRYNVYLAGTSMAQDFNDPVLTTAPGATSVILDQGDSPLIQPNAPVFAVVRALDRDGNEDDNLVETFVQVVATASVAYVEPPLGSTELAVGVLGDPSQPFSSIYTAVAAVEAAGGGVVLVAGATGPGLDYDEELDIVDSQAAMVEIYGGFPRFSQSPGTTGSALLALRDATTYLSVLHDSENSDQQLIKVQNGNVLTAIDGFVLAESGIAGVQGVQSRLLIGNCRFVDNCHVLFGPGAAVPLAEASGQGVEFRVVGCTFDYSDVNGPYADRAINAGMALNFLSVQNCDFRSVGSAFTATDGYYGILGLPTTGTLDVWMTHNVVDLSLDAIEFFVVAPGTALPGSYVLHFLRNEINDVTDYGFRATRIHDVGPGGHATVEIRNNLVYGTSSSGLVVAMDDVYPAAGSEVTIDVSDNTVVNSDSRGIEVAYTVGAQGKTDVKVNDNVLGAAESQVIQVEYHYFGSGGLTTGGLVDIEVQRNLATGGGEQIELSLATPVHGVVAADVLGNRVLATHNYALMVDLAGFLEPVLGDDSGFDGVFFLNIADNDVRGGDEEPFHLEDGRGQQAANTAVFGCVSNNVAGFCGDTSYASGLYADFYGKNATWLLRRNFFGAGGQDDEPAVYVAAGLDMLPQNLRLENNVMALAHGPGLALEGYGPRPQLVNDTIAFNGENDTYGVDCGISPSQLLLHNCIVSHSGGADLDVKELQACYSTLRSGVPLLGYANHSGDPNYAVGGPQYLTQPSTVEEIIASVFSLAPASACRNAGDPDVRMNDPDGSRCDIGAHGGPGAGAIGPVGDGHEAPFLYLGSQPQVDLYTGALLHDPTEPLALVFSRPVDPNTLSAITFSVNGSAVPGSFDHDVTGRVVSFAPASSFALGGEIVRVTIGAGLKSVSGQTICHACGFDFAVRPGSPVISVEPNSVDDSVINAADLAVAQNVGFGPGGDVLLLSGEIFDQYDVDVIAVQLDAGNRLMATLIEAGIPSESIGNDLTIDVYDAAANRLQRGAEAMFRREVGYGDACYLDFTAPLAGTYYLVVLDRQSSSNYANYELQAVIR
ncbi:MAG: hypothetical protein H6807_04150 [Planctomycetes bacterium]|nr:hypothetical protein [Planctomycetota bacterium]